MKTLITAIVLALASNLAMADGFAPWDARTLNVDAPSSSSIATTPAGFAPWREHTRLMDINSFDVRIGDAAPSAFRPWS